MSVLAFNPVTWLDSPASEVVDSAKLNQQSDNEQYLKQNKLEVGYNNDDATNPNGYCLQTAKKAFTKTTYIHQDSVAWDYEDPITLINLFDTPGVRIKHNYHIGFDVDFTRPTTLADNDFDEKGQTVTSNLRLFANVDSFAFNQIDGTGDFDATMIYHNLTCEATELNSTTIRVHVGGNVYLNLEEDSGVGVDAQVSFTGNVNLMLIGKY